MKYCKRCILPDTRPNLVIDEKGTCNACNAFSTRKNIDWAGREASFSAAVKTAKKRSNGYDCVIPVSGGKDSTWQVIKCLEYGLNPLAVTWKTPARTEIGARNLKNLIGLGVNHIDFQVNPGVEKKFMYKSLVKYGSTAIPMHMAIFNIPVTIAAKFNIPLIIWGENSAFEYGSAEESDIGFRLDGRWVKTYGVTHGTTAKDWVSDDLTEQELTPYFGPGDEELEKNGIRALFLGYYFPWDPEKSLEVAADHGFLSRKGGPRTGYYNYADIDDDYISIHHYLKWYKFGLTRTFDNLAIEIRNNRISREDAIKIIRSKGEETPHDDIRKCCNFMGITEEHFFKVIENFRNTDIWEKRNGSWMIRDFLIPDWKW